MYYYKMKKKDKQRENSFGLRGCGWLGGYALLFVFVFPITYCSFVIINIFSIKCIPGQQKLYSLTGFEKSRDMEGDCRIHD